MNNFEKINPVTSIIIVGGGTSGWLSAAYLYKNQPNIKITVVDKEIGNSIGVGEATLLSFKPFMEECGFDIEEWFVPLDAGYKSGILFANWRHPGNDIWHPFYKGNRNIQNKLKVWDAWSKNQDFDFKKFGLSYYDSSVLHNTVDHNGLDNYAFHVDCGKLVTFIQEKLKNKIKIVKSDVMEVNYEQDKISSLLLKDGTSIAADLYVDCTGFNNILKKPNKRIDLSDRLFVNTAAACPVPYENKSTEFKPYAVCEAVDHGWIWKIGVASRIGSGLVFNRNITDIDKAKDCFVSHWSNRIDKNKIRIIHWDPFYNEDQWESNVVRIGLSAGFIEPLESTGIGLITYAATQLNSAINERQYSKLNIDNFNLQMKILFEDCIDFVSMHYANNDRTSDFWNWVRERFQASDRMKHFIEELENENISVPYLGKFNYMFGGSNWSLLLIQLGFKVAPRNNQLSDEIVRELLLKNYLEHEKNKHVWSRQHHLEVERIHELLKL